MRQILPGAVNAVDAENERERRPQQDHAMKWHNRTAQGF
jgi:hypothetical protein